MQQQGAYAKGFHFLMCDICNRVTIWYKSPDQEPIHCTYHTAWNGKKHVVVNKESNHVMVVAQFAPVHVPPTERELKNLNRMDLSIWRRGMEKRKVGVSVTGEDWVKDLFPPDNPEDLLKPGEVFCSFCLKKTSYIESISENRPKQMTVQDIYKDDSGEFHIKEKTVTTSVKVTACPKCVLNIKKPQQVRTV